MIISIPPRVGYYRVIRMMDHIFLVFTTLLITLFIYLAKINLTGKLDSLISLSVYRVNISSYVRVVSVKSTPFNQATQSTLLSHPTAALDNLHAARSEAY